MVFALGDQPFHFAEQMGNTDLVVEGRERNFKIEKIRLCQTASTRNGALHARGVRTPCLR
ncbi:hypothetical protein D3C80_1956290 [compost metagenome]